MSVQCRTGAHRLRLLNATAIALVGAGLSCLAVYALAQTDRKIASEAAMAAFERARDAALARPPDRTDWSAGRRAAYEESLQEEFAAPGSLLHVPSIELLVPVFDGTGELALNRGIGWIESTAPPGSDGNVGLAGHRDGFFRKLKNLRLGDELELRTIETSRRYRVASISIVEPADVYVLEPSGEPSVTLVTCYPFYFLGNAPRRYIVRGVLHESRPTHVDTDNEKEKRR